VLTPFQLSPSLVVLMLVVIVVGLYSGHVVTAIGIAVFILLLAAIEGKPSWRRIFDPDAKEEAGIFRFVSWKRLTPRPNDRDPTNRR
jgi:hypothetical protein